MQNKYIFEQTLVLIFLQIATLFSWIPSRYKLREIERIYSPRKMGFNLNTMITKCGKRDPTLLVMKSNTGNVFGMQKNFGENIHFLKGRM